jgi:drug/metabolite transporter (DMT)-like permease
MLAVLAARRGWTRVRPSREQLPGLVLVGLLLPGANAVVTVAEVHVPSGLAALLIASVPLVLIVLRTFTGDRVAPASVAGVILGFGGVALLLLPGERPDGATLAGMLGIVGAAVMWATGTFSASRMDLPPHPMVSTGWQMLLGGLTITAAGLARGEAGDVHLSGISADSALAFAYLVLVGSIVAFSAYAWLLRNVPVSKVGTYAYVNPAIAIFLGWLILDETITGLTLVGAAIIVAAVAVVVRSESRLRTSRA